MRRRLSRCTASAAVAEAMPVPRLHLHKHRRLAIARDDVQFSTAAPIAPGNNCVPAALQFPAREIFADFPSSDSSVRHPRSVASAAPAIRLGLRRTTAAMHADSQPYPVPEIANSYAQRTSPSVAPRRTIESRCRPVRASAPAAAKSGSRSRRRRAAAGRARTPRRRRRRARGRALLGLPVAHQLDADHQPAAANVADERVLVGQRLEAGHQVARRRRRRWPISRSLSSFERRERGGARHRVAAKGAGVRARRPAS